MSWPSPDEARRCRAAWRRASTDERSALLTLACNATVLYLRVAGHRLAALRSIDQAPSLDDEQAVREACRVGEFEWSLQPPRTLTPSRLLCEQEDTMDLALSLCVPTLGELEALLIEVRSGRISAVSSRFPSTWREWAGQIYTFLVIETIVRIDAPAFLEVCRLNVQYALTKPPPSKLRSWPPKKLFGELKRSWDKMDVEQRVRMSVLSSKEYWFIQACDFATVNATLLMMQSKNAGVTLAGLETARKGTHLLTNLDVKVDPVLEIFLSASFVVDSGCLDSLYRRAVWHAADKDALLRQALCFPNDALFQQEPVAICAFKTATWVDIDRVVSTLLLEGILQRYAMEIQFNQARIEHEKKCALEAERDRQAASRVRQENKKAKRLKKLALSGAKKTQTLLDDELSEITETSQESTRDDCSPQVEESGPASNTSDPRTVAASLRTSTLEMEEVDAEYDGLHRVSTAGRRLSSAERLRTRELLEKAPSWDASCLHVCRTFVEVKDVLRAAPRSQTPGAGG